MVNFVVCQDFGVEFLAKAKALRPMPRPRTNITEYIDVDDAFMQRRSLRPANAFQIVLHLVGHWGLTP